MEQRRKHAAIWFFHVLVIVVAVLPSLRVTSTIVEAPPHLLTEEEQRLNDEDVAAFVSSDHSSSSSSSSSEANRHIPLHQQHNTQQVQTPEEIAAFVTDHAPNKNFQQQQQQPLQSLQQQQQQQQRRWGTATGTAKTTKSSPVTPLRTSVTSATTTTVFPVESVASVGNESFVQNDSVVGNSGSSASGLPFVPPKVTTSSSHATTTGTATPVLHAPPEGFVVTARVYTDPVDKLSHFDSIPTSIVLPFYECGAMGLATNALPLSHASFRHALAGSQVWSGDFFLEYHLEEQKTRPRNRKRKSSSSSSSSSSTSRLLAMEEDERQDWHPQLVVALTDLEIVLNSGETMLFHRGDVILLEDTVLGGHKLRAVTSTGTAAAGATAPNSHLPHDMTVMILTLPHYYHQVGKDHHSLQGFTTTLATPPCPVDDEDTNEHLKGVNLKESAGDNKSSNGDFSAPLSRFSAPFAVPQTGLSRPRKKQIQQIVLGLVGISVSTLLADFLGKVAPLWLAVGVGGTCFVVGCTYGIVTSGMQALEYLDMNWERHRLLSSMTETTATTTASSSSSSTPSSPISSSSTGAVPSDRPELRPKPPDPPFYER